MGITAAAAKSGRGQPSLSFYLAMLQRNRFLTGQSQRASTVAQVLISKPVEEALH